MTTPKTVAEAYADAARKVSSMCPKCGGDGWLWGHELVVTPDVEGTDDTKYSCDSEVHDYAAAILARTAEVGEPAMTGAVVKPLDWQETPNNKMFVADHGAGHYIVTHDFDGWLWLLVNGRDMAGAQDHPVPEKEVAKAAAQADYEARILAALAPPAMPTLAQIIAHYGIDALCKALAPEIVREAGQSAPWMPPEDRPDRYRCWTWWGDRWLRCEWRPDDSSDKPLWWVYGVGCVHHSNLEHFLPEPPAPTAFAPLPGDAV
jgi:hypothetical protein